MALLSNQQRPFQPSLWNQWLAAAVHALLIGGDAFKAQLAVVMNLPPSNRFHLLPALAILVAAWLVLAWPWLSGAVTVPWDSKAHFQPQLSFLAHSLRSGESPFWAPYVFAGHPQIADPQSLMFSPPFLAMALLDPNPGFRSLDAATFLALLAGSVAIVFYFRDRRWKEAGALIAAISFAFGGAAAWRIQHVGQVVSLAWLPIALFLLDRALARGSLAYGFAAGVASGFMLLGRDQVAFLGVVLLAAYAVHKIVGGWRARRLKGVPGPLAFGALGGLLTVAVPLVLTLLVAADSNRPEISLAEAGKGSLHPASLLTAIIPHLYGISRPISDYWGPPSQAWEIKDLYLISRNMATLYFGLIPMVVLALFLPLWRFKARFAGAAQPAGADPDPYRSDAMFMFVAFVILTMYSLGRNSPVFGFFFEFVPGVDRFRRPADALFVACAVGSMASGYALHRWLFEGTFRLTVAAKVLAIGLFAVVFVSAALVAIAKDKLWPSIMPMVAAACFTAAAVLTLIILKRLRERTILAALVASLVLTADLAWNNAPNESTGLVPETYDVLKPDTTNATIAKLKELTSKTRAPDRMDRIELAGVDFHWANASLTHRLYHTLGYNPVRSAWLTKSYGAGDNLALPDQKDFTPLNPGYRSLMTDMIGLRYIATRGPLQEVDPKADPADFPLIERTEDAFIYENPRALPRVLFPAAAQQVDFADMTKTGRWPEGFDPRDKVLLGRGVDSPTAPAPTGNRTVRIMSYKNTEVVVEAVSETGGFVVLNDAWDEWWEAEVDGRPARIEQANVMFRAVAVPGGTVRVRFVYRPFRGALGELLRRK